MDDAFYIFRQSTGIMPKIRINLLFRVYMRYIHKRHTHDRFVFVSRLKLRD